MTTGAGNKVHDSCAQCHGGTGTLISSASGKEGATVGTPNDCSTCHNTFVENHTTSVSHTNMVSMNSNCSGCHVATGNTVNLTDSKVHDSCAVCHAADGKLIGAASGQDAATLGGNDGGGDCSTCHGSFAGNHANIDHDTKGEKYRGN